MDPTQLQPDLRHFVFHYFIFALAKRQYDPHLMGRAFFIGVGKDKLKFAIQKKV
jgi:hypothetical protein